MLGLGNNDDEERFWNFIVFKVWATDEELEEMGPFLVCALFVVLLITGICVWFTR